MRCWRICLLLLMLVGCSPTTPAKPTQPPTISSLTPTQSLNPTHVVATTLPIIADEAAVEQANQQGLERDLAQLAVDWRLIAAKPPAVLPKMPPPYEQRSFWVTDLTSNQQRNISATLQLSTTHLLIYVADDLPVDQAALSNAATQFEQVGWPLLAKWYPQQAWPKVPVTVLNTKISGAGGYYASDNELPQAINPFSNEREMVVINAAATPPSDPSYVATVIHEMQHLLQRNVLSHPATWINEGASMLSEQRSGYGNDSLALDFLASPDTQLNAWASSPGTALKHYGAAQLFLRYLDQQLDGLPMGTLAAADAGDNLTSITSLMATRYPDLTSFDQVFAAWSVANLVNDRSLADGRYGYDLPRPIVPEPAQSSEQKLNIQQFGSDYLAFEPAAFERTVEWQGNNTVPIFAADVTNSATWWSGRGDARVSTLTTALQVPSTGSSLSYQRWFDLEQDYDYAYLSVSLDQGQTWQAIATQASTGANPVGLNIGAGWTGQQTSWQAETVDLTPWAGQHIQLRFWVINDEAYNAPGLALSDLTIAGLTPEWQGAGFVRVRNQLAQRWMLTAVLYDQTGAIKIMSIPTDNGKARWVIPANQRAVLVINATTQATTEAADYSYNVTP
ncbi:immune inhibitor A domain-containing protein [Herpetosiphon geysericola]|uniref:Uncharacterized protein n=1 Tax=Herpetosiphon geysericola TaxID=70996 RepID=A0A0P6XSQ0_9CHLR|nr:immune inhibitor A domain-containing protein [Herpetosiphon geysericola]KPL86003.1 hypothetical protein SE18_14010 [Herpetosiphon geysericola]